jgi:hypothetical protein
VKNKLYLQTTSVSASKTASEIVASLVESGAREILTQYEGGKLVGIRFSLEPKKGCTQIFSLPAKTEPVFKVLCEQKSYTYDIDKIRVQAERVAWRLLLRWVQSQLALIQVGMVEVDEVFLPYRQTKDGRTFWELVQAGGQLALPPGQEETKRVNFDARKG